jgi:hypothetical protein
LSSQHFRVEFLERACLVGHVLIRLQVDSCEGSRCVNRRDLLVPVGLGQQVPVPQPHARHETRHGDVFPHVPSVHKEVDSAGAVELAPGGRLMKHPGLPRRRPEFRSRVLEHVGSLADHKGLRDVTLQKDATEVSPKVRQQHDVAVDHAQERRRSHAGCGCRHAPDILPRKHGMRALEEAANSCEAVSPEPKARALVLRKQDDVGLGHEPLPAAQRAPCAVVAALVVGDVKRAVQSQRGDPLAPRRRRRGG